MSVVKVTRVNLRQIIDAVYHDRSRWAKFYVNVSANIEFRKWGRECFPKPESVKTVGPTVIAWACHVNYTVV